MSKAKLTKEGLKRFSISYNKAQSLGITDEDLKHIYVLGSDKYRISLRYKHADGTPDRYTEVVYGLLEAINTKWKFINSLKNDTNPTKDVANQYADLTVEEGFKKFFEYRQELVNKKKLRRATHEKNLIIYEGRHIRECNLLKKKIVDVTEEDAQDYIDKLFSTTKVDCDELLSENTINNPYALIHLVFEYFRKTLKVIPSNPFDSTERKPKYKAKNRDYLASVDIQFVLNEVEKKNIRFKTLVNLVLETGMRIEELTAIKYSDINRRRNTISIIRSVTKSRLTGELIVEEILKTDSSVREISISDYTLSLIDNYKMFKEHLGVKVTIDDFVFTSWYDNELVDPDRYTGEWYRFIQQLGYNGQDLPLRITRHSSASFMLQGETNIKAVKRRFGWSKDSTVMEVYNQSNLDDDRKLLDKFDEEFRNNLGASYAELYSICMNRLNNKRMINKVMHKILNKPIDTFDYETDLQLCKNYLFDLFPVFSKIAKIDAELDDEEVKALLVGFKPIYKKIKVESITTAV